MRLSRILGLSALVVIPATAVAQDSTAAPVPCRTNECSLTFDWGNGTSAASLPTDRRYGAPLEFETTFKQVTAEKGLRFNDRVTDSKVNLQLRLSMMNAMCDFMAGTNTDNSCRTMKDVAISFSVNDPLIKKKLGSARYTNRCGAGDQVMTMSQFGRYVAEMIQVAIEGEEKHLPRPAAKC